ncbi:MAG: peroxiredoxin [Thaumarchaeota archaeon]|jgi:peroxiredoxin family protein|nr:peroxiredoxin [Nitrososphaerota archaeon]
MVEKLSMIVFSGTVDKLYPVSILASGAVAMGMDVEIFITFWGLNAFRKDQIKQNTKISKDFEEMGEAMMKMMQAKNVPSWYDILKQAKSVGNVKIHACSMTMDLMGMTKEHLDDIVDDVVGVGSFIDIAKDSKITLFI